MKVGELLSVLDESRDVRAYCTTKYGKSFEETYDGRNSISPAINDYIIDYVSTDGYDGKRIFISCFQEGW